MCLVGHLSSRLIRSIANGALLLSGWSALKAVTGAQDLSLRAQNELWRGQNSKKNFSERALGTRFGGYGGLWGTERRPGESQGGLQELQSYDPWSLSSDYEPSRSRWLPPKSSQGASWEPKWRSKKPKRVPQSVSRAQKTSLRSKTYIFISHWIYKTFNSFALILYYHMINIKVFIIWPKKRNQNEYKHELFHRL